MEYGIMLCLKLDDKLQKYQSNNLIFPVHLTLGYMKIDDDNKEFVFSELKKLCNKKIKISNYKYSTQKLSLLPHKKFLKIFSKYSKFIVGIPRGGFHITLSINKKISVRQFKKDIKLPMEIEIDKIWVMRKTKDKWVRSKIIS